jgi:hypothetical protein
MLGPSIVFHSRLPGLRASLPSGRGVTLPETRWPGQGIRRLGDPSLVAAVRRRCASVEGAVTGLGAASIIGRHHDHVVNGKV